MRCAGPPSAQTYQIQHFPIGYPELATQYDGSTTSYPVTAATHLAGISASQGSSEASLFSSGPPQPLSFHTTAVCGTLTVPAAELGNLPRRMESCLPAVIAATQPLIAPIQYRYREHAASHGHALVAANHIEPFAGKPPEPGSHQVFEQSPLHWSTAPEAAEEEILLKELGSPEEVPLLEGLGEVGEQQGCQEMPDRSQLLSLFDDAFPSLVTRAMGCSGGQDLSPPQAGSDSYDSAGSEGTKAGRRGGRKRNPEPSEASTDYGSTGSHERRAGGKRPRPSSSESITDAQRARCRETARRLRQKKADALLRLHQDVDNLAQENQSLIGRLKHSVALLDKINHQNSGLRTILQCLKPGAGSASEQMSAALTELARLERVSPCQLEERRPNQSEAADLAALALVRSSGRPGAAVEQLVQLAISQPVFRARRKQ